MRVTSAQVSAIAHATENPDKVIQALNNVCPRVTFQSRIERKRFKGHYGNEIVTFALVLKGRSADSFFHRLWSALNPSDRELVLRDLNSRLDEDGRLHLRLDKQESFRQVSKLRYQDPIKIQLTFHKDEVHEADPRIRIKHELDHFDDSQQRSRIKGEADVYDIT